MWATCFSCRADVRCFLLLYWWTHLGLESQANRTRSDCCQWWIGVLTPVCVCVVLLSLLSEILLRWNLPSVWLVKPLLWLFNFLLGNNTWLPDKKRRGTQEMGLLTMQGPQRGEQELFLGPQDLAWLIEWSVYQLMQCWMYVSVQLGICWSNSSLYQKDLYRILLTNTFLGGTGWWWCGPGINPGPCTS